MPSIAERTPFDPSLNKLDDAFFEPLADLKEPGKLPGLRGLPGAVDGFVRVSPHDVLVPARPPGGQAGHHLDGVRRRQEPR